MELKGQPRVIVVYGGGFQPFHMGHMSSYMEAKVAFPDADFYVAASNDTKTRPIPFDAKKFLAQQAGVVDDFVQVRQPINPQEIMQKYDAARDILVLVRSERDPMSYTKKDGSPGYYQPFVSIKDSDPFEQHGYIFVTKKHTFKVNGKEIYSGSQVREMYANADEAGREAIIAQLYPDSNQLPKIKQIFDQYLGQQGVAEGSLNEYIDPGEHAENMAMLVMLAWIPAMALYQWIGKIINYIKLHGAENIINSFEKKGITVDRATYERIEPLLDELKQELTANKDGTRAKALAKRIKNEVDSFLQNKQGVAEGALNEFAPDDSDGGEEDTLLKFARMWYNGDLPTQQQIEKILARSGWEIGELESEEGGAFVVQSGDEHGRSYIGFSAADLTEGLAEGWKDIAIGGAMALGALGSGHAQAADLSHFNTQYLQQVVSGEHPRPMVSIDDAKAELQARANGKQQTVTPTVQSDAPKGYSKEYLQKAADPNRVGRYLISVEKAQELLKQGMAEGAHSAAQQAAIAIHKKEMDEAEGDPEGVPHVTRELLKHIIDQVGTEGAHAIVKSLEWGDGASKELLQIIKKDLEHNLGKELDEASLGQMRDFFAGQLYKSTLDKEKEAKAGKIADMRAYFANQDAKNNIPANAKKKSFRSVGEYQAWLRKQHLQDLNR